MTDGRNLHPILRLRAGWSEALCTCQRQSLEMLPETFNGSHRRMYKKRTRTHLPPAASLSPWYCNAPSDIIPHVLSLLLGWGSGIFAPALIRKAQWTASPTAALISLFQIPPPFRPAFIIGSQMEGSLEEQAQARGRIHL
ncbi:hypothetical protein EYF80_034659 [Liparis tanakae]|uniref:Uncharacterized protein n=1 Tax=Liparis tanakae TaxID=230148 RepID=A0A4Z2GPU7_9TELE|nr:hypothetical protein EYF80_034659 [Liparis tanakae]